MEENFAEFNLAVQREKFVVEGISKVSQILLCRKLTFQ